MEMNDSKPTLICVGNNDLLTKFGVDFDGDSAFTSRFKYSKKPNKTKQNRNIKARKRKLNLYKQIQIITNLKTIYNKEDKTIYDFNIANQSLNILIKELNEEINMV